VTDRCRGVGRLVVVDYLHWAATSRLAFNGIDPRESLLNEIWLGPERRAMGRGKTRHPARLRAAQSRRNWVFGRNLESRAPLRYAGPSGVSTAYLWLIFGSSPRPGPHSVTMPNTPSLPADALVLLRGPLDAHYDGSRT